MRVGLGVTAAPAAEINRFRRLETVLYAPCAPAPKLVRPLVGPFRRAYRGSPRAIQSYFDTVRMRYDSVTLRNDSVRITYGTVILSQHRPGSPPYRPWRPTVSLLEGLRIALEGPLRLPWCDGAAYLPSSRCLSTDEPRASARAASPCEGTQLCTVRPRGLKPAALLLDGDLAMP